MKYQIRVLNTDVVLLETDNYNDAVNEIENYVDIDSKFGNYEPGHYALVDLSKDKIVLVR